MKCIDYIYVNEYAHFDDFLIYQDEGECDLPFPHLPNHSETKPTQKEESMPPMEKMATDRDQREVSVPEGMGSWYRCTHVALYSSSMIC